MDQPDEVDGWPVVTPVRELPKPIKDRSVRHSTARARLIVCALNLPVCPWLGSMLTPDEGRWRMFVGVTVLYAVGWAWVHGAGPLGRNLLVGEIVVLSSWIVPFAQVWAGGSGVKLGAKIAGVDLELGIEKIPFSVALIATP